MDAKTGRQIRAKATANCDQMVAMLRDEILEGGDQVAWKLAYALKSIVEDGELDCDAKTFVMIGCLAKIGYHRVLMAAAGKIEGE